MKKILVIYFLFSISLSSFSQLIIYESDNYMTFEINGDEFVNRVDTKDSCRIIMQTFCECAPTSNSVLFDFKKLNKWKTIAGQILLKGESIIDPETGQDQTGYPIRFLDGFDMINGLKFIGGSYSMLFADDMIFIAGDKNGLAIMNVKVRVEH